MIVPEFAGFGQLRPVGPEINEYSRVSVWPPPFAREETLIEQNKLITLKPPMAVVDWPGSIQPPNIPNSEGEEKRIKREMNTLLWPYTDEGNGPWSLNEPRGYVPNWKNPGLGQAAGDFPTIAFLAFAGGLAAAVVGVRNEMPIATVVGVLATVGGGLVLKDRYFGK